MKKRLSDWLIWASAAGLILMTAIVCWQVFGRFVLNESPSWSEQAALILMIWFVMFAAAAGVREGFHIRIAFFEQSGGATTARRLRLVIHLIVFVSALVLFYYGSQLVWLVRDHVIPSLGLSRAFAYFPIPVSGALMAVFAAGHFIADVKDSAAGEGE